MTKIIIVDNCKHCPYREERGPKSVDLGLGKQWNQCKLGGFRVPEDYVIPKECPLSNMY